MQLVLVPLLTAVLSSMPGEAFAPPRPTYSLRSTTQRRAATLPQLETPSTTAAAEPKSKELPFYAKLQDSSTLLPQEYQRQEISLQLPKQQQQRKDEQNLQMPEVAGLATWITALSSFLLVNNFIGPWPANLLAAIPVKAFGLTHAVAGMLFGGGIILTTLIEWLATGSKDANVLSFYFDKVPKLDALVVLPALTASIVSGVGLAVDHYGSLGNSPFHIVGGISTLLAFAIWWAVTDVTTQGAAMEAIQEWTEKQKDSFDESTTDDVPQIVQLRKFSNVVSCLFVAALYGFMVLKPGFAPPPVMG